MYRGRDGKPNHTTEISSRPCTIYLRFDRVLNRSKPSDCELQSQLKRKRKPSVSNSESWLDLMSNLDWTLIAHFTVFTRLENRRTGWWQNVFSWMSIRISRTRWITGTTFWFLGSIGKNFELSKNGLDLFEIGTSRRRFAEQVRVPLSSRDLAVLMSLPPGIQVQTRLTIIWSKIKRQRSPRLREKSSWYRRGLCN